MPADRLLGTLLRSLQTYAEQQDTPRLLGTASSLLTTLNNPLNVTLLTSQLLSAPAIWARPDGLRGCMQCFSVFHSAAQALVRHENAERDKPPDEDFKQLQLERTLPRDDWIRAVVSGADEHSPRWRHLLVLGGLLIGFGPVEDENLSRSMKSTLEGAFTTALNLALGDAPEDDELAQQTITAVLNYCFPSLSDHERAQINYDALLQVLMRTTLHSSEGLQSSYFVGAVDVDVQPVTDTQFQWSERSPSYQRIQRMLSSPIVSSLGPLSRLIGHTVEQIKLSSLVTGVFEDLHVFARTLHMQWRQNKLSEIDISEEHIYLEKESQDKTTPQIWKVLRSTLFAVVIILRSALGRALADRALANDEAAPKLAAHALQTLRSLYFITARISSASFSQYTFVYLTAIDILATSPAQAEAFLHLIKPADHSSVPQHPLDRCLDLFFLNTSEHFTLALPPRTSEELVVAAALPYLAAGGNNNLLPIFEAAHSVMLAVFSAPQNAELTARQLPFYIDALFKVFPANLTARQFRLAFKTLLRLTSPPALLAASQPMLAATLLELLRERAVHASTFPLFPPPTSADATSENESEPQIELSEQAVLTLTVIDTLTQISLDLLDEWLPIATDMVNQIEDSAMRECCKQHFWHVLVDGEMDPDRSQVCHAWWSTDGGREILLYGGGSEVEQGEVMSGALPGDGREAKL